MKCYVCVYRQPIKKRDWEKTWKAASGQPSLKNYLQRYKDRYRRRHFYDWGDDPSFFAAEEFLGDVRKASWGVCRGNVRKKLGAGDLVIFFCAQEQKDKGLWKYYYIGFGTVGKVICDRKQIWTKKAFKAYRKFYNLLVDSKGCQREWIHAHHKDWLDRVASPYIIFESSDNTHFNVTNPLHVATYRDGDEARDGEVMESWILNDKHVKILYGLLKRKRNLKKLRTSTIGNAHVHMVLSYLGDRRLRKVREQLMSISEAVAQQGS